MRVVRSLVAVATLTIVATTGAITTIIAASQRHPRSVHGINKGRRWE